MSDSTTPTPQEIGAELRSVVKHLDVVASHVRVCATMLEAQNADDDVDAVVVLRQTVGGSLYGQTRRLARLASRCDGLPADEDYLDDDGESDDKGGAP
jgi:hypothetical protein